MKAYIFSLAPVTQQNHENEMQFPYNIRFLMSFWNLLNFRNSGSQSVAAQADLRGAPIWRMPLATAPSAIRQET